MGLLEFNTRDALNQVVVVVVVSDVNQRQFTAMVYNKTQLAVRGPLSRVGAEHPPGPGKGHSPEVRSQDARLDSGPPGL